MRKLTIKRRKKFAACLSKMKVYIEDYEKPETYINDLPCRKLGDIKNGEEKTFEISENEARLIVIADQVSKNFCNEIYSIVASSEDIYLEGENVINPGAGNPFRFDGNTDVAAVNNRKKSTARGIIILLIAVVVGLVVGCFFGRIVGALIFALG